MYGHTLICMPNLKQMATDMAEKVNSRWRPPT